MGRKQPVVVKCRKISSTELVYLINFLIISFSKTSMNDTFQFIERARLLLEQGRVTEAVQQIKNALQQDPDNDDALS